MNWIKKNITILMGFLLAILSFVFGIATVEYQDSNTFLQIIKFIVGYGVFGLALTIVYSAFLEGMYILIKKIKQIMIKSNK